MQTPRNKPQHFLFKNILDNDFIKAFDIADNALVNSALKNSFEINNDLISQNDLKILRKIIYVYELYIIDLQTEVEKTNDKKLQKEYFEACNSVFRLMRVLPLADNSIEKIKFIYKLISYSYLGQSWESGRRYLLETKEVFDIAVSDEDSWEIRVFKKIYLGFINLVIKLNREYLEKSIKNVNELRTEQKEFETKYLQDLDSNFIESRSYELISLYHFAKTIELLSDFMLKGNTTNIRELLEKHFRESIKYAENSSNIEMVLILRLLSKTFEQMVRNSIWIVTKAVNSRVTKFVNSIINSDKPIYELLYPQRTAILDEGLFDVAHNAIVVNMPTSSGKTQIAEFKILQTLNLFEDGWIAYVAPTKALVNQVYLKLHHDFKDIGVRVQKLSGAIDLDIYDENVIKKSNDEIDGFDILVVTPEKLNLLIRQDIESKLDRPLVLTVVDEAHNIEADERGLNYEMLLANISNDCPKSKFLLLTPFIKNAQQIANWLDKDSPSSIQLAINWKPNDKIIGAFYPEGNGKDWNNKFETFITTNELIQVEKNLVVSEQLPVNCPISTINISKTKITSIVAKQLNQRNSMLIVCGTPSKCWNLAKELSVLITDSYETDPDIELVKKYITAELGTSLSLNEYLDKRIGIHHAGISDEIRFLIEWLMINGKLNYLVATTTIAQGINFPVSTILMQSYSYPGKEMPTKDFLNLVGRAGRTEQDTLGVVGIALCKGNKQEKEYKNLKNYLNKTTEELLSNLVKLLEDVNSIEDLKFNTNFLFKHPQWSQFLQYITHIYNQINNVDSFSNEIDIILRKTLGYSQVSRAKQDILIDSVKNYILRLDEQKGISKLSDGTGFSFESIKNSIVKLNKLKLTKDDWSYSNLFSNHNNLKEIMGIMLYIPEIRSSLKEGQDFNKNKDTLAKIVSDWVNGKKLEEIAAKYFAAKNKSKETILTDCYRKLNRDITYAATWGLSSLQRISGLDFENMNEEDLAKLRNTAAMIYYGVNSDEAVLMRKSNIPRSVAKEFGEEFKKDIEDIYKVTPTEVQNWLDNLSTKDWDSIVTKQQNISGSDYKRVWEILNAKV
jgi:replicative superfamily II helicase